MKTKRQTSVGWYFFTLCLGGQTLYCPTQMKPKDKHLWGGTSSPSAWEDRHCTVLPRWNQKTNICGVVLLHPLSGRTDIVLSYPDETKRQTSMGWYFFTLCLGGQTLYCPTQMKTKDKHLWGGTSSPSVWEDRQCTVLPRWNQKTNICGVVLLHPRPGRTDIVLSYPDETKRQTSMGWYFFTLGLGGQTLYCPTQMKPKDKHLWGGTSSPSVWEDRHCTVLPRWRPKDKHLWGGTSSPSAWEDRHCTVLPRWRPKDKHLWGGTSSPSAWEDRHCTVLPRWSQKTNICGVVLLHPRPGRSDILLSYPDEDKRQTSVGWYFFTLGLGGQTLYCPTQMKPKDKHLWGGTSSPSAWEDRHCTVLPRWRQKTNICGVVLLHPRPGRTDIVLSYPDEAKRQTSVGWYFFTLWSGRTDIVLSYPDETKRQTSVGWYFFTLGLGGQTFYCPTQMKTKRQTSVGWYFFTLCLGGQTLYCPTQMKPKDKHLWGGTSSPSVWEDRHCTVLPRWNQKTNIYGVVLLHPLPGRTDIVLSYPDETKRQTSVGWYFFTLCLGGQTLYCPAPDEDKRQTSMGWYFFTLCLGGQTLYCPTQMKPKDKHLWGGTSSPSAWEDRHCTVLPRWNQKTNICGVVLLHPLSGRTDIVLSYPDEDQKTNIYGVVLLHPRPGRTDIVLSYPDETKRQTSVGWYFFTLCLGGQTLYCPTQMKPKDKHLWGGTSSPSVWEDRHCTVLPRWNQKTNICGVVLLHPRPGRTDIVLSYPDEDKRQTSVGWYFFTLCLGGQTLYCPTQMKPKDKHLWGGTSSPSAWEDRHCTVLPRWNQKTNICGVVLLHPRPGRTDIVLSYPDETKRQTSMGWYFFTLGLGGQTLYCPTQMKPKDKHLWGGTSSPSAWEDRHSTVLPRWNQKTNIYGVVLLHPRPGRTDIVLSYPDETKRQTSVGWYFFTLCLGGQTLYCPTQMKPKDKHLWGGTSSPSVWEDRHCTVLPRWNQKTNIYGVVLLHPWSGRTDIVLSYPDETKRQTSVGWYFFTLCLGGQTLYCPTQMKPKDKHLWGGTSSPSVWEDRQCTVLPRWNQKTNICGVVLLHPLSGRTDIVLSYPDETKRQTSMGWYFFTLCLGGQTLYCPTQMKPKDKHLWGGTSSPSAWEDRHCTVLPRWNQKTNIYGVVLLHPLPGRTDSVLSYPDETKRQTSMGWYFFTLCLGGQTLYCPTQMKPKDKHLWGGTSSPSAWEDRHCTVLPRWNQKTNIYGVVLLHPLPGRTDIVLSYPDETKRQTSMGWYFFTLCLGGQTLYCPTQMKPKDKHLWGGTSSPSAWEDRHSTVLPRWNQKTNICGVVLLHPRPGRTDILLSYPDETKRQTSMGWYFFTLGLGGQTLYCPTQMKPKDKHLWGGTSSPSAWEDRHCTVLPRWNQKTNIYGVVLLHPLPGRTDIVLSYPDETKRQTSMGWYFFTLGLGGQTLYCPTQMKPKDKHLWGGTSSPSAWEDRHCTVLPRWNQKTNIYGVVLLHPRSGRTDIVLSYPDETKRQTSMGWYFFTLCLGGQTVYCPTQMKPKDKHLWGGTSSPSAWEDRHCTVLPRWNQKTNIYGVVLLHPLPGRTDIVLSCPDEDKRQTSVGWYFFTLGLGGQTLYCPTQMKPKDKHLWGGTSSPSAWEDRHCTVLPRWNQKTNIYGVVLLHPRPGRTDIVLSYPDETKRQTSMGWYFFTLCLGGQTLYCPTQMKPKDKHLWGGTSSPSAWEDRHCTVLPRWNQKTNICGVVLLHPRPGRTDIVLSYPDETKRQTSVGWYFFTLCLGGQTCTVLPRWNQKTNICGVVLLHPRPGRTDSVLSCPDEAKRQTSVGLYFFTLAWEDRHCTVLPRWRPKDKHLWGGTSSPWPGRTDIVLSYPDETKRQTSVGLYFFTLAWEDRHCTVLPRWRPKDKHLWGCTSSPSWQCYVIHVLMIGEIQTCCGVVLLDPLPGRQTLYCPAQMKIGKSACCACVDW